MHSQQSPLGAIALLVIVVVVDVWVFLDSQSRANRRRPVVASIGSLVLDTPQAWTLACLLLWVLFFPMYLAARSKS